MANDECERESDDKDDKWLPELNEFFSGNYNVLIDLKDDPDSEVCHHVDRN